LRHAGGDALEEVHRVIEYIAQMGEQVIATASAFSFILPPPRRKKYLTQRQRSR
jgi:hypothetical protein